jgi:hypothetical protein
MLYVVDCYCNFRLYPKVVLPFSATNTMRFGNPDTALGSPTFGQVFNLGPGFAPKRTQIVARFEF